MYIRTLAVAVFCLWVIVECSPHPMLLLNKRDSLKSYQGQYKRNADHQIHLITDCIYMASDEGRYYHKANQVDGTACGIYLFADPDQRIEVHFNNFDVSCDNGGLVSFVDGWELNGQFFPSPEDHPRPMESRYREFCNERKVKQVFLSSQNVALIQYRMPARGSSFSFTVRFIKNPTPCNVLLQNTEDIVTLRNYGRRSNCSISALFPAAIRVVSLDVGVVSTGERAIEIETGTLHKCQKRGLEDYVQIGGSAGLDNAGLLLADSVCGIDSKPGDRSELIGCGTSTVRLVSSGGFDNSVTVIMRELNDEDIAGFLSVICPIDGLLE